MQKDYWNDIDFDKTVKDFEFTRRALRRMNDVVYSADFEEMDSNSIMEYLINEMEIISFKDYLKRYIYKRAGIDIPFKDVTDDIYQSIIMDSFLENGAPHSFEPTTKRWPAIVKSWLTQNSVKRDAIFLIGFGLKMSDRDVSEFLTKVIQEEDFRNNNPREYAFRYCYQNGYRYAKAVDLIKQADASESDNTVSSADEDVIRYIRSLKQQKSGQRPVAYSLFMNELDKAKQIIAEIYQNDEEEKGSKKKYMPADISNADVEKVIYAGVPVTQNGNLQKMQASSLAKLFHKKRLSRQRLENIVSGSSEPDRYDLITLLFFIYSQEQIDLEPEIRCRNFIDETNAVLEKASFMGLHPVNPYESFVLMCLLSDTPLATYSEIWEMSYEN